MRRAPAAAGSRRAAGAAGQDASSQPSAPADGAAGGRRSGRSGAASSALERALALLARREHAPAELAGKLSARGYPREEIEQALARLAEQGLLSAQRYLQARVRHGLSRGHGPRRIRQSLQQAGVDSAAIDAGLGELDDTVDWVAQAAAVLARRFGDAPPADAREWARRARFLQARGYDEGNIRKLLGAPPRQR